MRGHRSKLRGVANTLRVTTDHKQLRYAIGDQAVEQLRATIQGWPRSRYWLMALRAPRTWIVSFGTLIISSLLITVGLALLRAVSPSRFASLFAYRLSVVALVPLCLFFLAPFYA